MECNIIVKLYVTYKVFLYLASSAPMYTWYTAPLPDCSPNETLVMMSKSKLSVTFLHPQLSTTFD